MDYKENIKVGGGPIETNQCFYEKAPISVLGCALIFNKNNKISYEYHDFLSEILSYDSLFSGECFIELLKSKCFDSIDNIKIWTDNGNHFRSQEFLYYVFIESKKYFQGTIKYNRFVKCHGKSLVDGHFGVLTKIIKQKELEKYIKNLYDLKETLEEEERRKSIYLSSESNMLVKEKCYFHIYKRLKISKKLI